MAIYINTTKPNGLLKEIISQIKEGKILTWNVDEDGDFTHDTPQWNRHAWFKAKVSDGKISFYIFPPMESHVSIKGYAIYHGRFIEMLLSHVDGFFDSVSATSYPEGDDVVSNDSHDENFEEDG